MEKINLWERYSQFYEFGFNGPVDVDSTNEVYDTEWNGSLFWTFIVPHVAGFAAAVAFGCIIVNVL